MGTYKRRGPRHISFVEWNGALMCGMSINKMLSYAKPSTRISIPGGQVSVEIAGQSLNPGMLPGIYKGGGSAE
jgi:hypothetical protein